MNEQSGNSGQLQGDAMSGANTPIDVTDPWRGLYLAERLIANGDGDLYHPDFPSWPDDREDALDELVHAQGFDFQIVAGYFTEEALENGDDLYWQEMRAWKPEAPGDDWRLAWKGDTEDGPYAWFVRPMALRPNSEALAARQPVGQDPVAAKPLVWSEQWRGEDEDIPVWIGSSPIALPVRFGFAGLEHHNEADPIRVAESKAEAEAEYQARVMSALCVITAPPAPAAVPVGDEVDVIEALLDLAYAAWSLADDAADDGECLTVDRAGFDALSNCLDGLDDLPDDQPGYTMEAAAKARWALRRLLATHPQPAAAKDGA